MQIDSNKRRISSVSRPPSSLIEKPRLITASEERQLTGRYIALGAAISLITLAIYHAWERKFAVLAGLFTPALIMFLYILWMLFSAHKDAKKMRRLQQIRAQAHLIEAIVRPTCIRHDASSTSTTSLSKLSTSSKSSTLNRNNCAGNSLSSSKSSLISQKNYIIQNMNQKNKNANAKNNVYYPEVHQSRRVNEKLDSEIVDNDTFQIENEKMKKYRLRLKRQMLSEPIRVQLGTIEKGLARTYSIA